MNSWKRLKTTSLLNHPRLKVVEDTVELPSGLRTDYLRFETNGNTATVIAINNEEKILLQKEYSYPTHQWLYQFPGGFVPESEDIEDGANRELMEESGFKAQRLRLLGSFYPNNRRTSYKAYVYLGKDLIEQHREKDNEEYIESYWMKESEIDSLIKKGELINGLALAAWSLYKAMR